MKVVMLMTMILSFLYGCDQSLTISTQEGGIIINRSTISSVELKGDLLHITYVDGTVQTVAPFQLMENPKWTKDWELRWKLCMKNAERETLVKDRMRARENCSPPEKYIFDPMYPRTVAAELR